MNIVGISANFQTTRFRISEHILTLVKIFSSISLDQQF